MVFGGFATFAFAVFYICMDVVLAEYYGGTYDDPSYTYAAKSAMALRFSALVFIACFAVFLGAVSAQYGGDGGDNNMPSKMPGMPMGPAPPPSWASVNASPAAAIGFLSLVVSFFVVKRA
nr:hypothetical protein CTI12_AA129630 [Ipomoea batatas]